MQMLSIHPRPRTICIPYRSGRAPRRSGEWPGTATGPAGRCSPPNGTATSADAPSAARKRKPTRCAVGDEVAVPGREPGEPAGQALGLHLDGPAAAGHLPGPRHPCTPRRPEASRSSGAKRGLEDAFRPHDQPTSEALTDRPWANPRLERTQTAHDQFDASRAIVRRNPTRPRRYHPHDKRSRSCGLLVPFQHRAGRRPPHLRPVRADRPRRRQPRRTVSAGTAHAAGRTGNVRPPIPRPVPANRGRRRRRRRRRRAGRPRPRRGLRRARGSAHRPGRRHPGPPPADHLRRLHRRPARRPAETAVAATRRRGRAAALQRAGPGLGVHGARRARRAKPDAGLAGVTVVAGRAVHRGADGVAFADGTTLRTRVVVDRRRLSPPAEADRRQQPSRPRWPSRPPTA